LRFGIQAAYCVMQVVVSLAEKGDIEALVQYSGAQGTQPDYMYLLQSMMMSNPQASKNLTL
jgi:clathrin heavy chain